ncbi:MAG: helix-turn-helix domain-containing protein [Candidatus Omnitrophica bacterium]|nr:helix-turn-helix domain-containing protein [Candidatus Omnitrophota bacterium]
MGAIDLPELMTVEETAALLRIKEGTLHKWCQAGKIPHIAIGRRIRRFRREDLDEWIQGNQAEVHIRRRR